MENKEKLLSRIKRTVSHVDSTAELILYGSYARGDHSAQSDLDLLILLDQEKITRADEKRLKYPLYDIEFETGIIISPMVLSRKEWEDKCHRTPFRENVSKEGRVICL